jgi:hypothetical protein
VPPCNSFPPLLCCRSITYVQFFTTLPSFNTHSMCVVVPGQGDVSVTIFSSVNALTQVQKLSSFQSLESLPQFQITTQTSSFVFRPATQFPLPQLLLIPAFYLTTLFFKVLPPTSSPQTQFSSYTFFITCTYCSSKKMCWILSGAVMFHLLGTSRAAHLVSTNQTPVIFIQVA